MELLIALAIAVLLLTVLFAAYFPLARLAQWGVEKEDGTLAAAAAFDTLTRDFMCALAPDSTDQPPFTLATVTGHTNEFCCFYSAEPAGSNAIPWLYNIRQIRLAVRAGANSDQIFIERWSAPLPGAIADTNRVRLRFGPFQGFFIEARDGEIWTNRWTNTILPPAVRITLLPAGHETPFQTEIGIPSGITITNAQDRDEDRASKQPK